MKRKRTELVYCSELDLDLPDDCWERVFTFVNEDGDEEDNNRRYYLNSISLVSKQFLSITNRHKLCLRICHPTLPFLHPLLRRFTNLTTLDFSHFHAHDQLNDLLSQISDFPLNQLTSLNISDQSSLPAIGLQAFSSKVTSLTYMSKEYPMSVTSNFIHSLTSLKALTCLHLSSWSISDYFLSSIANQTLPLTRLGLGCCTGYTYSGILAFLSNCLSIQHLDLQSAHFLTDHRVAELSSFLPHLVSINLSYCRVLTDSAFFALLRNCTSLTEIIMKSTRIAENTAAHNNSMDSVVYPKFKSLCLAYNSSLKDDKIIMFASLFPNLQLLDLTRCSSITEQGIGHVLRTCCKIRHLNLYNCPELTSLGIINFELPYLEFLDLTNTRFGDEALCVISMSCPALLQLSLLVCKEITDKGVMDVVKNCTKLREIILDDCLKVHGKVVASMVLLRPSLRKIVAPPDFPLTDRNRKIFSRYGCLLE